MLDVIVRLLLFAVLGVGVWVFVSAAVLAWRRWSERRRRIAALKAYEALVRPLLAQRLAERR